MVENTVSGLWFNSQLLDTSQIEKFYHNGEHIMWQILLLLSLIIHDSIKQRSAAEMSSPMGVSLFSELRH